MSGRGDGRLFRPSPEPLVTIGLTLSTSSPTLIPSPTSSFYIILTARVLHTTHPSLPITLATHLNPFSSLSNRSFANIVCISSPDFSQSSELQEQQQQPTTTTTTTTPATTTSSNTTITSQQPLQKKQIEIYPRGWPQYRHSGSDLRSSWDFVTIPPQGQGELVIRHQLRWEKIEEADVKEGERYKVSLTNKCLGTRWWGFGSLDEQFKGVKLREWREGEGNDGDETSEGHDGELGENAVGGERPEDLALVIENEYAVFEIG